MHLERAVALLALLGVHAFASPAESFDASILQSRGDTCPSSCLGLEGTDSRTVGTNGSVFPFQVFQTVPYNPPQLEINKTGAPLAPGYIFIAPSNFNASIPAVQQPGPYIMTDTGDLIWSGPVSNATNFKVQELNGKPVITFWSGYSTAGANIGHGYGSVKIYDTTYKKIATVCPKLNLVTAPPGNYSCENDLHESYITEKGTMLITAYNVTTANLTSVGGPAEGYIYDGQFYEIDIATNKILFKWSSIEHIPISASHQPLNGVGQNASEPYDYYHINSVQSVGDNYLVNSRHTWTTSMIAPTGDVIWTIEGQNGGDFGRVPPHGHFEWQHDARVIAQNSSSITISYFNNRNTQFLALAGLPTPLTPLLILTLPLPPNKNNSPTIVHRLVSNYMSDSQGSFTLLPDGHQTAGYGQIPVMREYGTEANITKAQAESLPVGGALWEARYGADNLVQSYRSFKSPWVATPGATVPTVKVVPPKDSKKCGKGYVSWNGATEVEAYEVYAGERKGALCNVGKVWKNGFETGFGISAEQKCVRVTALNVHGEVLGTSKVTCA